MSSQVSYWKDKIELYIVKVRAVLNRRRHQVELRVRLSNSSQAVLYKTYLVYLALVVRSSTIWTTLTVRLTSTPRQNAVVISHFCRCAADVYGKFCVPARATWANFCCLCAAGLSNPNPIKVYFLASYRPYLSHFWTNVNSAIPTL